MDGGAETTEATETTVSLGSALAASRASLATTFASPTTGAAYLAPATFASPTFVSASGTG